MQCPNCDKQISPDQKFCRFCGRSLEAIAKTQSAHSDAANSAQPMAKVTTRMPARRMNRATFWGLIVVGLGVTLLANAQDYNLLNWIGILLFLAGIALAIYGVASPNKALNSPQSSQPKSLNQSAPDLFLPRKDFSEPLASVTERTTELLEEVRRPKVTNHRDG